MRFDAIVIGAGAAGLMCAAEARKRGRTVALVEHSSEPGRKILISGGGRCNFTNVDCEPANFLSANQHFCKSALARYTPEDFLALVRKHHIPYHEKKLGQLFCDRSAKDILALLLAECAGVQMFFGCEVGDVRRAAEYVVSTSAGELSAPALVIATGGLSIPKIGATNFGYRIAKQFGLKLQQTRPALVPLTLNAADRKHWCDLPGVAADVTAQAGEGVFREKLLITHRGLSGPAILQISSYWSSGQEIAIDLLPEGGLNPAIPLKTQLRTHLVKRLADRWFDLYGADPEPERRLHRWTLQPDGTEGYEKAEVTAGGVDTTELSSKTMEARKTPGLFFIGEVVDVTGHLGGFNFQWAWASAVAAAQAL